MCTMVKRGLIYSIDEILLNAGFDKDIKLFGQPIEDIELDEMKPLDVENIRNLLLKKIDKLAL